MLYDYYLKFNNVDEFNTLNLKDGPSLSISIDIPIMKETGEVKEDDYGNQYPVYKKVDGYFVNLRSRTRLDELDMYFADANTYQQQFAGDATYINNVKV